MNVAEAESGVVPEPAIITVYGPGVAVAGTVNEALSCEEPVGPGVNDVHTKVADTISVGVDISTVTAGQPLGGKLTGLSLAGSNPVPVIVTAVVIGPEVGLSVIVGPVAVNVARAESRV